MQFDLWTLGLQAANFLVLVWLLHRFLYRPVLAVLAARKAATDKLTADAEAAKAAAETVRLDLERQRASIDQDRHAALKAAHEAADAESKAVLARARAEAEALGQAAQAELAQERAAIVASSGTDAARLAIGMVRRLVDDPAATSLQAHLLDLACEDLRALPAETKRQIAERLSTRQGSPQVVTAMPLDETAQDTVAGTLTKAFGAPLAPVFRVDANLLAGVEIHFPFTILRRSWAERLKQLEAEVVNADPATIVA
ncbi:MAG: F-type H+-transporting ATPase subunit b [Pseudoalteromonas distincta]|jgi:F-type H+-transporting ATPase subunit b